MQFIVEFIDDEKKLEEGNEADDDIHLVCLIIIYVIFLKKIK
jgi:hypothetical protein